MVIARNSNLLGKITILVMFSFVVNTAVALDGSGTQKDPWRIKTLEDFNDFAADANYWDDYTRLETDVNLAGRVYERAVIAPDINDSNLYFDGTSFTGIFDGNDHKIIGLTIDDAGAGNDYLGLFGCIGEDGQVSKLALENVYVSGDWSVGGLVGANGDYPLIGGVITNCYSTGSVSGNWAVGGLVGGNYNYSSFSNCYSTVNVSGDEYVGGLMGVNVYGYILNCYSTGDVSGGSNVGGLAGWNDGSMGYNSGIISNCYSTGDVNGVDGVGGVVGTNWLGSVSNCFWDTDTQNHGVTESIGDNVGTVTNVLGLLTSLLHQQSTFTDWDFINVWNIGENQTYPYLRVYLPSDINKDGIVNFLDVAITANQWLQDP